jgi:hypothetical protein
MLQPHRKERVPANAIVERCDNDSYKIDPMLFSPPTCG